MPSMMLAWLRRSEKTASPRPTSAERTPTFGEVAGAEEERGLGAVERGDPLLELERLAVGADDEPRGRRACSPLRGPRHRLGDRRVAGEPEVVVRGEVDEPAPVALDDRPDRPVDGDEAAQQPGLLALRRAGAPGLPPRRLRSFAGRTSPAPTSLGGSGSRRGRSPTGPPPAKRRGRISPARHRP